MNDEIKEVTTTTTVGRLGIVKSFATPIAIVVAGAMIAGAVLFNFGQQKPAPNNQVVTPPTEEKTENLAALDPVTAEDHIRGNPDAPVKIVEYSDTECPFCKRFHGTMQEIMKTYEASGQVAWVYRHFPLDQLHKKARLEAEATECAEEQGGDVAFWKYLDRLMEITPSNDGLDPAELPKIATYVGLDEVKFNECLASGRYDQKIEAQVQNAIATGGRGTPWSIVIGKNDTRYPLSGAQPVAVVKQLIELALKGQ